MRIGQHLKRLTESVGPHRVGKLLIEGINAGKIDKHSISIRELAESFMGYDWPVKLNSYKQGLLEATEAVDASAFSNITGQLLINEVKERYQHADFVGDQLCTKVPITNGNLQSQKTPWLGHIVQSPEKVPQGMPYPRVTFGEQYIEYPAPEKRGFICQVTFEMIFSDLTGQALEAAGAVGERLGIDREERILKVVLGIVNNHSWNGTSYNTYLTSGAWINKKTSVSLTDWTNFNAAEQLLWDMVDPVTSKPINVMPDTVLVMPAKYYTAKRILHATQVASGDITAAPGTQTWSSNPLEKDYKLVRSIYGYRALIDSGVSAANAAEYWTLGAPKKAFVYREVFPLTTQQAPPMNLMEFEQDVVVAVRANEYGIAGVKDPRYNVLNINS